MIKSLINRWQSHWEASLTAQKAALYRISFFSFLYFYYSFLSHSNMWQWSLLPNDLWVPAGLMVFFTSPPLSSDSLLLLEGLFPLVLMLCALGLFTKLALASALILQYIIVSSSLSYGSISHTHFATTLFLFLFIFLDCSQCLSLDSLILKKRHRKLVSYWPIQLQRWAFGAIFFAAAYSKLTTGGLSWFTTDTLKNYLSYSYYRYSLSPLGTEMALGLWMTKFPLICKGLALSTIILELSSPVFVVLNRRILYILIFFHFMMIVSFYFLATTGFVNMFSIYLCWLFNPTLVLTCKANDEAHAQ